MAYKRDDEFYLGKSRAGYKPVKAPATINAQLAKLKERGCSIEDEKAASDTLRSINYYRLVNYFEPFLENKHRYRAGTSFERVMRVYSFDKALRHELWVILEEIEVALRAVVSNYHALKYGALGYLNPDSFGRGHRHPQFNAKIEHLVEMNEDEELVAHHVSNYGGSFPLWVIMELFSFGMLACFYTDMQEGDKKAVADTYGLSPKHLDSWLTCLTNLRNYCAHYNRLYSSRFHETPIAPPEMEDNVIIGNSVYDYIYVMRFLYRDKADWNGRFMTRLSELIAEYGADIELSALGFPPHWQEMLVLKD